MIASIKRSDVVLMAATGLAVIIVAESLYVLHFVSVADPNFSHYKDIYDSVVKGTLMSLLTIIVTVKVGYTVALAAFEAFIGSRKENAK